VPDFTQFRTLPSHPALQLIEIKVIELIRIKIFGAIILSFKFYEKNLNSHSKGKTQIKTVTAVFWVVTQYGLTGAVKNIWT
jgi:uncharacterized membrane protein